MMKSVKTGRKGDPRMHRAVAARLANPDLSLFDALRIGGFEYTTDEDASIIDSEKVTLAQRKNQLSRRLRFARKQQDDGDGGGDGGPGDSGVVSMIRNSTSGGGGGGGIGGSNNSPANVPGMSSEAQKQLEKLMQHSQQAKLNSGVKRNSADMNVEDEEERLLEAQNQSRRVAKFHPQYQPLFIPRAASVRSHSLLGNPAVAQSLTSPLSSAFASQLSGGSLSGQTLSQLTSQLGGSMQATLGGATQQQQQQAAADFQQAVSQGASNPLFSHAAASLMGQNSAAASSQRIPSGVAVRSLAATAQSVGMTLEQLAVSLASSSNLAKVLSGTDGDQQHELALRLYQNEARALYQRCMLLAGYNPEDAAENSQTHLEFALSAWQLEGKRLQDLVGNEGDECMDAPGVANADVVTADQQQELLRQQRQQNQQDCNQGQMNDQQQFSIQSHGHSHEHGHSHDSDGGECSHKRHVHQLEGKCGHKAIIHQPEDGPAHIDFVVGNKVECYNGIQPASGKSASMWPSKYNCDDLRSTAPCQDQACRSAHSQKDGCFTGNTQASTILDLDDIDLEGKEWKSDLNGQMDGPLLGLINLGDNKSKDNSQCRQGNKMQVMQI